MQGGEAFSFSFSFGFFLFFLFRFFLLGFVDNAVVIPRYSFSPGLSGSPPGRARDIKTAPLDQSGGALLSRVMIISD